MTFFINLHKRVMRFTQKNKRLNNQNNSDPKGKKMKALQCPNF